MNSQLINAYSTGPRDCSNTTATFNPEYRVRSLDSHSCNASAVCLRVYASLLPLATSYTDTLCSLSAQSNPIHTAICSSLVLLVPSLIVLIFTFHLASKSASNKRAGTAQSL